MEIKDFSIDEKALKNLGEGEKPWNTSSSDEDFKKLGKEKVESLRREIIEIKELIKSREKLSKEVFNEADKVKMEVNNFLAETHLSNPNDPQEARDRVTLKQKQVEIAELQLNEKINCWKDIAQLKRDLRDREKELKEKESRLNMLDKILEE